MYTEVSSQPIHENDHLSFVLISCAVRHRFLYEDILYPLYFFSNSSWLLRLSRSVNLSMHKLPCLSPIVLIQTSKVYRCWMAWGRNMRVMIIPAILAFTFLGLSTYLNSSFTSQFQYIAYSSLDNSPELIVLWTRPRFSICVG